MNKFAGAIAAQAETEEVKCAEPLPVVPGRKVHIDGDYLCYYASGNDETEPGMARLNALDFIRRAQDFTGSESAVLHLTASGCHKGERYLAATVKPYQQQRSDSRRPKNWGYLREWSTGYRGVDFLSKVWSSREADDGIAACAHFAAKNGKLDAICTADKDMRMLPGLHLNWKDHTCLTVVGPDAYEIIGADEKIYGWRWFWLQMLQGDAADNIPGLEQMMVRNDDGTFKKFAKVGEKTAEKLLVANSNDEAYSAVWEQYRLGYNSSVEFAADRFVEQACLLWLRRGNAADVIDFMDYLPFYNSDVAQAAIRMKERIVTAREALNNP